MELIIYFVFIHSNIIEIIEEFRGIIKKKHLRFIEENRQSFQRDLPNKTQERELFFTNSTCVVSI